MECVPVYRADVITRNTKHLYLWEKWAETVSCLHMKPMPHWKLLAHPSKWDIIYWSPRIPMKRINSNSIYTFLLDTCFLVYSCVFLLTKLNISNIILKIYSQEGGWCLLVHCLVSPYESLSYLNLQLWWFEWKMPSVDSSVKNLVPCE